MSEIIYACMNGHMIEPRRDPKGRPRQNYCDICGSRMINACIHCNAIIKKDYLIPGKENPTGRPMLPKYCLFCGKPYPWTESVLNSLDIFDSKETAIFETLDDS